MADLALIDAPELTWRVERAASSLRFSRIDVIDASGPTGNRFDVPGAGVLYTATTKAGAFAETLARFRPTTSLIEKMRKVEGVEDADQHEEPGGVDESWFDLRRLRYESRLGDHECWAIFDGTTVEAAAEERIGEQPELRDVMDTFGLWRS